MKLTDDFVRGFLTGVFVVLFMIGAMGFACDVGQRTERQQWQQKSAYPVKE